mmetsp:Transcript_4066/g.5406  ORF Transcript_4066/g.5406 Transcript_4066/m.5406 type:complete len:302 (+) Transcript_4066:57-962(+)
MAALSTRVCTFWLQGNCRNGGNCKFLHDKAAPKYAAGLGPIYRPPINDFGSSVPVCSYYSKNRCLRGSSCRFLHPPINMPAPGQSVVAITKVKSQTVDPSLCFSIDVECVATGFGHNDRGVAQIALVDYNENLILNVYIKPDENLKIYSFLTPLTGITSNGLEKEGIPLSQALDRLREVLPKDAILIGQNIASDIRWCQLEEGKDFASLRDLVGMWRCWNTSYNKWSYYSLEHNVNVLLGTSEGDHHNAVTDARNSIRLFKLHESLDAEELANAKARLLNTSPPRSFSSINPEFEGVCQGS